MQGIKSKAKLRLGTANHCRGRRQNKNEYNSQEKNYGTFQCRNDFLRTTFSPLPLQAINREWNGIQINYINPENYEYLKASVEQYAKLLKVQYSHCPGKSISEGMLNLYNELAAFLPKGQELNLDVVKNRLNFVIWSRHHYDDYTLYWLPVKFIEDLPPELRKISTSFLHYLTLNNGFDTSCYEVFGTAEYLYDALDDWVEDGREEKKLLLESYLDGDIKCTLKNIQDVSNKVPYQELLNNILNYRVRNDYEKDLIDLYKEGFKFLDKKTKSIMQYDYDPYEDEDDVVELRQLIQIIYDMDIVYNEQCAWISSQLNNTHFVAPTSSLFLTPDTQQLFQKDNYPDQFLKFFEKFITIVT